MFGPRFSPAKCETLCRLCSGRIKLLRNKKNAQLKQMRKDIADLLRAGKQEFARIRVEAVIRENASLQAYEILELFLELVAVRAPLMAKSKEIPRDLIESVSSIIYAAQRVAELPELVQIRALLGGKFGKEYVQQASSDTDCLKWQVNEKLIDCLTIEAPAGEDKLEILTEIAQEYSVDWDAAAAARDLLPHKHAPLPVQPNYAPQYSPNPAMYGQQPVMQPQHSQSPSPQYQVQRPVMPILDPRPTTTLAMEAARTAQQTANQAVRQSYDSAPPPAFTQPGPAQPPPVDDIPSIKYIPPPEDWLKGPAAGTSNTSSPTTSVTAPSGPPPPLFGATSPKSNYDEPPKGYDDPPPPLFGGAPKSKQDIQKAYDDAPGPPSKPPSSSPPPMPSAPSPDLDLPSAPGATSAPSPQDELDELQKRFNALKNL